jgi:thiol-disulfide isomerase/thioredoxin
MSKLLLASVLFLFSTLTMANPVDRFGKLDREYQLPKLEGEYLSGEPFSLEKYSGKKLIINFWATWCGPCVKEMPALIRLSKNLSSSNFELIFVNYGETQKRVSDFWEKNYPDSTTLIDPGTKKVKSWIDKGLPTTYILNSDHEPAFKILGDLEWEHPSITEKLRTIN